MLAQKEKELKSLFDSNSSFWPFKFMLISPQICPVSCLSNPLRVYFNQIQLWHIHTAAHEFNNATSPLSRGGHRDGVSSQYKLRHHENTIILSQTYAKTVLQIKGTIMKSFLKEPSGGG